jgi:hypothetical protein
MIDRAARLTFRNFWTLFFVVAAITVPLQVAYATAWHNVIAVRELHGDIEEFPPLRQVHGVGQEQLQHSRTTYWVIVGVELALIPLLVRAAGRVLERDAAGEVASAADAWRAALGRRRSRSVIRALGRPGPLLTGAMIALAVGALVQVAGRLAIEPLGDERAFAGVGLVDGVARAAGAPFALVVAALCAAASPRAESPKANSAS